MHHYTRPHKQQQQQQQYYGNGRRSLLTRLLELVSLAELQHLAGLLLGGEGDLPNEELHEVLALLWAVGEVVQGQLPQTLVGGQNAAVLHHQELAQL